MAPFDESCVLIPASTLEDFPADAADSDARSLLAGWTVLWHPQLIAANEQLPTWFRADSPPEPDGPRIVVVPDSSLSQLPSGFQQKCKDNKDCRWIAGTDRKSMLEQLGLSADLPTLQTATRTIGVEDFFAAAYASLQIQIMTRRLRYTSNLDEIYLQKEAVAAAKAFLAGDVDAASLALHNVFDCLSEERDHYFSSDPHLIDLTLLTPGTLSTLIEGDHLRSDAAEEKKGLLQTPQNVLIDAAVAQEIAKADDDRYEKLLGMIRDGSVGWIGGAPAADACLDAMTFAQCESMMQSGHALATAAIGIAPTVYGRFSGSTPADMTPALVRLGYNGMVPIDFAHGTGYGDEAKVLQRSGGVEIESLTSKPVDASSDSGFLNLGARLGEAIDSGEIATGLLAHWPGQGCDSFHDLKRVASWCLALGRFWNLHDYFTEGEHPYHHATTQTVSSDAHQILTDRVANGSADPISKTIIESNQAVTSEAAVLLRGMRDLIAGKPGEAADKDDPSLQDLASQFAVASGATVPRTNVSAANDSCEAMFVVNPLSVGQRVAVTLNKNVDSTAEHVFAVDSQNGSSNVAVDVVAGGFACVKGNDNPPAKGSFLKRLMGKKGLADDNALSNEFMEVAVSPETGGIAGVYSGGIRGNRFSMRLVWVDESTKKSTDDGSTMKCNRIRVTESSASLGRIEVSGVVLDRESKEVATFDLAYELRCGSRFLKLSGQIKPTGSFTADPWNSYLATRVAVASESSIARVMVRDKLHRARGRKIVAPLGIVIDEAERQTLIGSQGLAFHRRVGDRFIDTLLAVKGEKSSDVNLSFGFDCPNPVGNAKALICPPLAVPIAGSPKLPDRGWITHIAPNTAMISRLEVHRRNDGRLAATVRMIQTRSQSGNGAIRFCRDVDFATTLTTGDQDDINQSIPASDVETNNNSSKVKWNDDAIKFSIAGHQVTDFLVVFKQ
ncbi:MAG: hypothetical protein WBD20_08175 [Pirellulaceae bacterium]